MPVVAGPPAQAGPGGAPSTFDKSMSSTPSDIDHPRFMFLLFGELYVREPIALTYF